MKRFFYQLVMTVATVAAVSLFPVTAAYAGASASQRDATHLTDSLMTIYEEAPKAAYALGPNPGLDDYLTYAAYRSPALKAAFYQWQSLLEKSGYVGSLPDPMLSYGYYVQPVETRVGPQNHRLSLRQTFPWFGTLGAKRDATSETAWSAYEKFESHKLRLFYQVKAAYYDYYYLGRRLAINKDNFELLTFWESVARAKYRVALTKQPDVIKAQVELGKLEDQIRSLEDELKPAAARLRAVLNLPDSVGIPLPTEIHVEEVPIDRDSVLVIALHRNPDLRSAARLIEKENAERRVAGKSSLPDFTIGVDYIATGSALNPLMEDSGKDAWVVSAGVCIPLWFGKNKARRQEAEALYRKAQYEYSDARNHLEAFTEKVVYDYNDALRKTRLYRDGLLPKAEQALNSSYTAYEAGETDFLNVLDAQRQLLDFQLKYEEARSDLALHRAQIEMITGRELETSPGE
ncbi:MAG: TolC family protein [bacterium]